METSKNQHTGELQDQAELNSLRKLITGLGQKELERLQLLMTDPHEFSEEISELLPHAIRTLLSKGEITTDDLLPIIEETIQGSIQQNPRRLADILYPVMIPAIRKAVKEDIKKMLASVNASLESGFSVKRLKWRLQALLSKNTYAEIVLANSFVYHVSHVFLIHRDTGLLLHEERSAESETLEANLVSAMLTAIRDFVKDSFKDKGSGTLEEIQVGSLNIMIEQGPYAIVASVVDGQPPLDYRETLSETIEAVHYNHLNDLQQFEGETESFAHTSRFLQNCLIQERKEKKGSVFPWPLFLIVMLLLLSLSWMFYGKYNRQTVFKNFVKQLDETPGYYITKAKLRFNTYTISGLKDPEAKPFDAIIADNNLQNTKIIYSFEPYASLDEGLVLNRAMRQLNPPDEVEMTYFQSGLLKLTGKAPADWVYATSKQYLHILGVIKIDTSELNVSQKNTFSEITTQNLSWIIPIIENYSFVFDVNAVSLDAEQQQQFDSLVSAAIFLADYNQLYNKNMAILISAYTSRGGNTQANLDVANRRAAEFVKLFEEAGLTNELIDIQIVFAEDIEEEVPLRSVTFKVIVKTGDRI